jgi:hypothetical protein
MRCVYVERRLLVETPGGEGRRMFGMKMDKHHAIVEDVLEEEEEEERRREEGD